MSDKLPFEYNAPTYVDFAKGFDDSEDVDKFFDLSTSEDSRGMDLNSTVTMNSTLTVPKIELEFSTPSKHSTPDHGKQNASIEDIALETLLDEENLAPNVKASCKTPDLQNGRRSRILFEALEGLHITGSVKTHKMLTRKDPRTPLLELRSRTVPRNINFVYEPHTNEKRQRKVLFEDEALELAAQINNMSVSENVCNETLTLSNDQYQNNLPLKCIENDITVDQKKRKSHGFSPSTGSMHGKKYISLAGSTVSYDVENKMMQEKKSNSRQIFKLTQPKTPKLETKNRVRQSNILSHSQEEERIMKELRENQPRALPIPKGLFNPPKLGVRKVALPKYNFQKPNIPIKKPEIPKISTKIINFSRNNCVKVVETNEDGMSIVNKEVGHRGVGITIDTNNKYKNRRVTKPQPFSFYDREMERLKKKNEKIKEIIEEEKKLAEFHATPLPRFVLQSKKQMTSSQGSLNMTTCSHSTICSVASEPFVFKAQSPTVLHQRPFIPRKSTKPCSQILDFTLHTEERSCQREMYENTRKQRELEMQLFLQEREREQKEREEIAYRMARKSTVHKPLPLPKFK